MSHAFAVLTLCLASGVAIRAADVRPVLNDIRLEKNTVLATPLVIEADGVTIDGNGATIRGPGRAGDLKSFVGNGVVAKGRSRITLRNLKVHGFESGLVASDGSGWTIEDCDFTGNYHDPSYGWGDYQRVGGLILTGISQSTIRLCRANNVWNGLDLWESNDNTIVDCDFSHCSNVCAKLWLSSRNTVRHCNLSYGLRISPGEVHARDSTSVLIETGSDNNRFEKNDITHGGDGVFIRVLNGWCSRGNVFVENDCSYANNNGFESWSPDNAYIRNKANHCSFGFWLGGSDHTRLIGNEAAFNGRPDGFHNAAEPDFIHGGIVIVGGSGTHTVIDGNDCHDNNGAGIVFRGELATRGAKWKMYHLIVQRNRLVNNKWGLFARFTDWLDLAGNTYQGNEKEEFFEEVTHLTRHEMAPVHAPPPEASITGPSRARVGEKLVFDASASKPKDAKLQFQWDVGGQRLEGPLVERSFDAPGFYRVGVTVSNGSLCDLAFIDLYVAGDDKEIGTEGSPGRWAFTMGDNPEGRGKVIFTDDAQRLVGKSSLRFRPDPYMGSDVSVLFPKEKNAAWRLDDGHSLSFWLKFENPNNGGFQGPNPIVRLHRGKAALTYTPAYGGMPRNLLGDLLYSEARHGWVHVTIPLRGSDSWLRSETFDGARPPHIDHGLKFITLSTPAETQNGSAMASDGVDLYCAAIDGDRLLRSSDGKEWKELRHAAQDLGDSSGAWINGMLAFDPKRGQKGRLYLRFRGPQKDAFNNEQFRLVAYDIATDRWSWTPIATAMGHGTARVEDELYGLAHAVGGNYGGPLIRVNLARLGDGEARSVLAPVPGKDAWWFSRAAQLATLDGRVYAIKNDWQTPQPKDGREIGDRLLAFDPAGYRPSRFSGGNPWDSKNWKESHTAAIDLGPLPFEIGHGAALVALPAHWCSQLGDRGGLFVLAGCSPSNHEGFGPPSARYALYDIATGKFTPGTLPDITGAGSSATLHRGVLYIKRGGMNYGPSNGELWVVTAMREPDAAVQSGQVQRQHMSPDRVEWLSIQFDSIGNDPFDVWVDGLHFAPSSTANR